MNSKVVYGWFDGQECFYIGIGDRKRAYCLSNGGRNRFTLRKVEKARENKSFHIQILHSGLTKKQACWYETSYIMSIGRRDLGLGTLTNLTDGGEGIENCSKETKEKISKSTKGRIPWNKGKERRQSTKDKISKFNLGNQYCRGRKLTQETKDKISKANKGKTGWNKGETLSNETKRKISEGNKGKVRSKQFKEKLSKSVVTPDGIFYSMTEAAKYYGMTRQGIRQRIKNSKYPDFYLSGN